MYSSPAGMVARHMMEHQSSAIHRQYSDAMYA